MEVLEEDLAGLMKTVWSSLVGLEVHELDGPPPLSADEPAVAARVDVIGAWHGAIAIVCSESLARRIAMAMFEKQSKRVTGDDIGDCLGELANVIGGNVKAATLVPGDVSLPIVEFGPRRDFVTAGSPQVWMACEGEPVFVAVGQPSEDGFATFLPETDRNVRSEP